MGAMKEIATSADATGEFIIYRTDDGSTEVHLRLVDGDVWMSQKQMAELFGVTVATISRHLKNIVGDGEVFKNPTVTYYEIVGLEQGRSVKRRVEFYSLDVILAVGYRVRGPRGSQFRNWASTILKEYLIKGFALNDEKLKDPRGRDYFDELLARIRDIRSSEARFYQKIRDIFSLADDYDPHHPRTQRFFQTIQDKLHYAITGLTASEIIATRCDPSADNLGLTSFKGNKVRKGDVTIAKNYLTKDELEMLNRLVSQFLDYAEQQALRRKVIHMKDWIDRTERFIEFNEFEPLPDHGRLTRKQAEELAYERYGIYDSNRRASEQAAIDQEIVSALQEIEQRILADRKRLTPRTTHTSPDEHQ